MNGRELIEHVKGFKSRGPYTFEVECEDGYAFARFADRQIGYMLAETAAKTGKAKYIKYAYYPPNDPEEEHILIDYPDCPDIWTPKKTRA